MDPFAMRKPLYAIGSEDFREARGVTSFTASRK